MMHLIRALEDKVTELRRLVDSLRPNGGRLNDIERDLKDVKRQANDIEGAHNVLAREFQELRDQVNGEFIPDHLYDKLLKAVVKAEALTDGVTL